jgi:hypothetical protein
MLKVGDRVIISKELDPLHLYDGEVESCGYLHWDFGVRMEISGAIIGYDKDDCKPVNRINFKGEDV